MNSFTRHEYNRLRAKNWSAKDALRAARVYDKFTDLENEGLVKLEIESEFDSRFCLDQDWASEKDRVETEERFNRDGGWILISYWRPNTDSDWEIADSIGGFIGDDWKDSGYDTDVRLAALDALRQYELAYPRTEFALEALDF